MHQPVRQRAVVGEQQQPGGVDVQPADHDPAPAARRRQALEHGRPPLRIRARGHLAGGLVIERAPRALRRDAPLVDRRASGSGWPSSRISAHVGLGTRSPSVATWPSTVTRPARIHCSIWRRDPWPAAASSFCSRSLTVRRLTARQRDLSEQLRLSLAVARIDRPIDQPARQVRAEQLNEVVGEIAQQRAAPKADPGGVDRKQVRGIDDREVAVLRGSIATLATMPTPEPEPHVGLDDIRIARRQRHLRRQSLAREYRVQRRGAGEAEHVGDQRILRQVLDA